MDVCLVKTNIALIHAPTQLPAKDKVWFCGYVLWTYKNNRYLKYNPSPIIMCILSGFNQKN